MVDISNDKLLNDELLNDELLNDYISGTISTILNDPRFKPGQIVQYLNNMPENKRYDTMINIFEYIFKNEKKNDKDTWYYVYRLALNTYEPFISLVINQYNVILR